MSTAAHCQTLDTEKPEWADCSPVAPQVSFSFSSVKNGTEIRSTMFGSERQERLESFTH